MKLSSILMQLVTILSFSKYFVTACCVPGTVSGTRETVLIKRDSVPAFTELRMLSYKESWASLQLLTEGHEDM